MALLESSHTTLSESRGRFTPPRCTMLVQCGGVSTTCISYIVLTLSRVPFHDYCSIMVCVMALPISSVHITSIVGLPDNRGSVILSLHLTQCQDDGSLRVNSLDVDAPDWPPDDHIELLTFAQEQAGIISEKLRGAFFDFTDTRMYVAFSNLKNRSHAKSPPSKTLPSIPSRVLLLPRVERPSSEEPTSRLVGRHSSPVQSIERLSPSLEARIEKVIAQRKIPTQDVHQSPESLSTTPSRPLSQAADRPSLGVVVRNTTDLAKATLLSEDCPPAQARGTHEPTEARSAGPTTPSRTPPPATPGSHEFSDPPESTAAHERSPEYSRETPGVFEDADNPGEVQQPSTPVPQDVPTPCPSSNKRPRKGNDDTISKREPKKAKGPKARGGDQGTASHPQTKKSKGSAAAQAIAARIGHLVRKGGQQDSSKDLGTYSSILELLRPEGEQLTLEALGPQQRIYTEKLLRSSAVARVIHSCCIVAYEHRTSIQDRHTKVRRSQDELRTSKRLRVPGTIFAEAIRLLADEIREPAYLLLTALSGKEKQKLPPRKGYSS